MKYFFAALLIICFYDLKAQPAYSHHATRLFIDDGVIVVPEVGNMHHLWVVTPNSQVRLQVYNQQLEWQGELKLPLKLTANSDVTVLPFANEYFFYNQSEAGHSKFLWRVDSRGKATDESSKLKAIIRSSFKDSGVVCQLYSKGSNVYLIGNVYYPELRKIITTIIQTNTLLELKTVKRYAFNFDHSGETLQRMVLVPDQELIVLKQHLTEEMVQILDVTKINLATKKINVASFKSITGFRFPDILYNAVDSSTTLCARISRSNKVIFAKLDDSLKQETVPTILQIPITTEMYGAFACINMGNGGSRWLPVYGVWNALYEFQRRPGVLLGLSAMVTLPGNKTFVMDASSFQPKLQAIDPYLQLTSEPGDVRFSVVDLKHNRLKDTTIKYYKRYFIEVGQYASFTKDNTSYLMVKEKYPSKGRGLLLLNIDKQGQLIPSPLRLYEKFHYAIPQLQQTSKGNLMFPYVYKNEVGLTHINLGQ